MMVTAELVHCAIKNGIAGSRGKAPRRSDRAARRSALLPSSHSSVGFSLIPSVIAFPPQAVPYVIGALAAAVAVLAVVTLHFLHLDKSGVVMTVEHRRHTERVHEQFSINRVSGNLHETRKAAMLPRTMNSLAQLSSSMRGFGGYAAVALVVPGGSLIAFTLWASRHRGWLTARTWRALLGVAALGTGLIFPG